MKLERMAGMIAACAALTFASNPLATANKARGKTLPTKIITDASINAGQTVTFNKDTIYILEGKVFVESGAVLTIEPGTVIKGDNKTGEQASALIICMGGKIIADGKKDAPIIMTSIMDDLAGSLTSDDKSGWGGLVILGKATTNNGEEGFRVEGIAGTDPRTLGGIGGDDDDSSGILRYVSIRHAGIEIAKDNELNSLSLVGVGRKTVIEHVEVFACGDDGIEIWGGTVNGKHLICAFSDDDAFDFDLGWRGKMQFIFSLQDSIAENMKANWAGEWDGDDKAGGIPFAQWSIANATLIGGGSTANTGNSGIIIRANGAGHVYNSILTNFRQNRGVVIEDITDEAVQDSRKRLDAGDITFKGNILWSMGNATVLDSVLRWFKKTENVYVASPEMKTLFTGWGNVYQNPMLGGIAYSDGANRLDPRTWKAKDGAEQIAWTNLATLPESNFFTTVPYKGAFGEENWALGWTALDEYGYFGDLVTYPVAIHQKKSHSATAGFPARVSNKRLTINYGPASKGTVSVSIRDLKGRTVAKASERANLATGSLSMNIAHLSQGMYVIETRAGGKVEKSSLSVMW